MRLTLVGLALLVSGAAFGQDGPKRVKTEIVHVNPLGMSTLYKIDEDGTVRIDWQTAEKLVRTKADLNVLPIAQLMLAIRDRRWKPMR